APPGPLLNVIATNELGDGLRRDALLPLGRQRLRQPGHAQGKGGDDPHPEHVRNTAEPALSSAAHEDHRITLRKLAQDRLEGDDVAPRLSIKALRPRRPAVRE